jgi:hypothetical protein
MLKKTKGRRVRPAELVSYGTPHTPILWKVVKIRCLHEFAMRKCMKTRGRGFAIGVIRGGREEAALDLRRVLAVGARILLVGW